ncbi:hypothetical protein GW17_00033870 [Ensete ventricosum]|nr:hypothetical protein GW17_00033870 [Ensete ventricosum]
MLCIYIGVVRQMRLCRHRYRVAKGSLGIDVDIDADAKWRCSTIASMRTMIRGRAVLILLPPIPSRKPENSSEIGDHFESGSQKSVDDYKNQDTFMQPKRTGGSTAQASADLELLGFGDEDAEEHLSDISDGVLSMGTETEGSLGSVVEFSLFPEQKKSSEAPKVKM